MSDQLTCSSCRYFTQGECRRYPPVLVLWPTDNQHPIAYFPTVTFPSVREDSPKCGEWSERP